MSDEEIEIVSCSVPVPPRKRPRTFADTAAVPQTQNGVKEQEQKVKMEKEEIKEQKVKMEKEEIKEEIVELEIEENVKKNQNELELMASMGLPTEFDFSKGRYRDPPLKDTTTYFCPLCRVRLVSSETKAAHISGKKHMKKMIANNRDSHVNFREISLK